MGRIVRGEGRERRGIALRGWTVVGRGGRHNERSPLRVSQRKLGEKNGGAWGPVDGKPAPVFLSPTPIKGLFPSGPAYCKGWVFDPGLERRGGVLHLTSSSIHGGALGGQERPNLVGDQRAASARRISTDPVCLPTSPDCAWTWGVQVRRVQTSQ